MGRNGPPRTSKVGWYERSLRRVHGCPLRPSNRRLYGLRLADPTAGRLKFA